MDGRTIERMSFGGHGSGGPLVGGRGVRRATVALFAAAVALAFVLVLRSGAGDAATVVPAKCDSYGTPWVKRFNKTAIAGGNPTRMISACCRSASIKGVRVHHCFIKLTLAGTTVIGCATYDLARNGLPVSPSISVGQHQNCPLPKKT
jgi:hypothetical protein